MNTRDSIRLHRWVLDNRQMILAWGETQTALAQRASDALATKVSPNSLKQALEENGLPTRRKNEAERKLEAKDAEIAMLREILVKVITASQVPDWLRKELVNEDLTEELKEVIRNRRSA